MSLLPFPAAEIHGFSHQLVPHSQPSADNSSFTEESHTHTRALHWQQLIQTRPTQSFLRNSKIKPGSCYVSAPQHDGKFRSCQVLVKNLFFELGIGFWRTRAEFEFFCSALQTVLWVITRESKYVWMHWEVPRKIPGISRLQSSGYSFWG